MRIIVTILLLGICLFCSTAKEQKWDSMVFCICSCFKCNSPAFHLKIQKGGRYDIYFTESGKVWGGLLSQTQQNELLEMLSSLHGKNTVNEKPLSIAADEMTLQMFIQTDSLSQMLIPFQGYSTLDHAQKDFVRKMTGFALKLENELPGKTFACSCPGVVESEKLPFKIPEIEEQP